MLGPEDVCQVVPKGAGCPRAALENFACLLPGQRRWQLTGAREFHTMMSIPCNYLDGPGCKTRMHGSCTAQGNWSVAAPRK